MCQGSGTGGFCLVLFVVCEVHVVVSYCCLIDEISGRTRVSYSFSDTTIIEDQERSPPISQRWMVYLLNLRTTSQRKKIGLEERSEKEGRSIADKWRGRSGGEPSMCPQTSFFSFAFLLCLNNEKGSAVLPLCYFLPLPYFFFLAYFYQSFFMTYPCFSPPILFGLFVGR